MTKTGAAARPTLDDDGESIAEWLVTHQRSLIIAAIVIAVGAGGGWLWKRSAEIKEANAAAAYQAAESAYSAGNAPLAQTELEKITTRWRGTAAGTQAAMLMAEILYGQGKYVEGVTQLEQAAASAPKFLLAGVHALVAGGREGEGKPAEAAAAYAQAAATAEFKLERQMYQMEQARTLRAAGEAAAAKVIYDEIAGIEDSPYAGEAKVRLGELLAKS
ncbi:MAG: tetratricopeptide repeat protein [Gemmatimonadota bacterium]|nr:tetratricopeptide repeat protein [Thermoleophilia bacterium]MDH5234786.1 tetratricopeptide repeat protein [Gemmatimonadota bacterium]